ncbi:MAG: carbon monoxide dehydrogenase subunit G [Deltaproteobacteria bacterium]|nr:carbon monoxide dehydrogenase subunit G [Deltaproteobacteria bacterium]MBW2121322.1 carbon monoxide dehydrogenase subunit G [Deltaproteobacteria bacterium]
MLVEERFRVKAPIQEVWDFLVDPEKIGPCVPGCEKIEVVGENVYESSVKVKVGVISLTMKSRTTLTEVDPPRHLKSVTEGRDALKAGTLYQESVVDLSEVSENEVEISYSANTRVVGKLATFGEKVMRATAKKLGEEFARNIQAGIGKTGE